jgi:flavorubredoxin
MQTNIDEIGDGIYRLSTLIPDIGPTGFRFNQFLIDDDEPMLYHTGMRAIFPLVSEAVSSVMPISRLRWISFSHIEADECGAMNDWLAAAPDAQVVHGALGCMLSVNDMSSRPPRPLQDGETISLGARHTVREIATPHVPHNWESHMLFEEESGTLFCGDIMTQVGDGPALTSDDILGAAIEAEHIFGSTSLGPAVPATLRRLADLSPKRLAIMHGSSYEGDCASALRALAEAYEQQFGCAAPAADGAAAPQQRNSAEPASTP